MSQETSSLVSAKHDKINEQLINSDIKTDLNFHSPTGVRTETNFLIIGTGIHVTEPQRVQ